MKIYKTGVFILVAMLLGCALPKPKPKPLPRPQVNIPLIPVNEMSFALKAMHFAGVNEFSDSSINADSDSPTLLGTASTISYLTSGSAGHIGDNLGLSQSTVGLGFLLSSLRNEISKVDQYDRMLFAFVPKSEAATKDEAIELFKASVFNALKKLDSDVANEVNQEVVDFAYDYAPSIPRQQVLIKTDRPLFYDGDEGVIQGSGDYGRAVRLFYMKPAVKKVSESPLGEQDVWYVSAMIYLTPYEEMQSKSLYSTEYLRFIELLPEWFFMFKKVEGVPSVLQADKMHLFVKPKTESARNASASSSQ